MTTTEQLLEQAKAAYCRDKEQHRDALLETGRLLHKFVLSFLQEGDGLAVGKRRSEGYTRQLAIHRAASALDTTGEAICGLIQATMAADLLSENGEMGKISWTALRLFRCFVHRRTSVRHGRSADRHASELEVWEIKEEFAEQAKALFRQAVSGEMGHARIRVAVLRLYVGTGTSGKSRPKPQLRRSDPPVTSRPALATLQASAAVASPGDVVEMILALIEKAEDPRAVAMHLRVRLEKFFKEAKPSLVE